MSSHLSKILIPSKNISSKVLKEEDGICVQFANFLREKSLESGSTFPYVWFHIPNEFSQYNALYGLKQSWMGRIPGAPDFCFIGEENSFFIEFKTAKGKQSPSQKIFQKWCEGNKVDYFLCRSAKEGEDIITGRIKPIDEEHQAVGY